MQSAHLPRARGADQPAWTVCSVTEGAEPKVADDLQQEGVTVFIPTVKVWGRPSGKRRCEWKVAAVFPGYLFLEDASALEAMSRDERARRRIWPVRFGLQVAQVCQAEIDRIRDDLASGAFDHNERDVLPVFTPGTIVTVAAGPFLGRRGHVAGVSSNGRRLGVKGLDFPFWTQFSVFDVVGPVDPVLEKEVKNKKMH